MNINTIVGIASSILVVLLVVNVSLQISEQLRQRKERKTKVVKEAYQK